MKYYGKMQSAFRFFVQMLGRSRDVIYALTLIAPATLLVCYSFYKIYLLRGK